MIHVPEINKTESGSVSILLVDDDENIFLLLQKMLSNQRYGSFHLRWANCLAAALRELTQGGIDLVLLDLGLPDSSGLDTFVQIHDVTRLPIIVLSGLDDETLATATVHQGAQDYIIKGQEDVWSLVRAIRYALERCHAQQVLAEEHDLLRGLLDNIPDQVYLKDMEGRFISVNLVTVRFLGATSADQIIGKSDFDFFPKELAAQFLSEDKMVLYGQKAFVNREVAVKDPSGNTRWVWTTKVPLRDHAGNIRGLLGINRDITKRKHDEEAICRLNAELEQRVAERTNELRDIVARLEEHDRAQSEFVSSVSHELKTPLTAMMFAIANLLDGVAGSLSDKVIEYLHILDMVCQGMGNTIDDILDLSRLENKTMRLHPAKLLFDRLVKRGVMTLNVQAKTKNIGMVLDLERGLGFVECDAGKMVRAMINIIGNAIKFTQEGGRVEIGLHRETAAADTLVLEITDNGIGIAPQHLARVTEKYFRAGEHAGGVGLGLSITKEIVELHGGWLQVQSPPPGRERGTRVLVGVPVTAPPVIAIVNDDESIRGLFRQQLCACGYRVVECARRDEAMNLMRQVSPDVGIIEFSTLGRAESDLVFAMKADPQLRAIPIVAVTDGAVDPARQAILNGLGIPALPNPWQEDDLLDRIEAVIRGVPSATVEKFKKELSK